MPRICRVVMPGYPHHIVQRGHDRNEVFVEAADYRYYLETLKECKDVFGVRLYAYCLMTNHVHLLLAPSDHSGIGQLMKRLAGRQTRYRNKLEKRRGTLWEGRYQSSLVDVDDYLMACVRYIELNPVRARMVDEPGKFQWSSYRERIGKTSVRLLDELTVEKGVNHGQFVQRAIPEGEWELIRKAVKSNHVTGSDKFCERIEVALGRRLRQRAPGWPSKKNGVPSWKINLCRFSFCPGFAVPVFRVFRKMLISDEVIAHLVSETAEQFTRTVNQLKGKVTVVFITHQMPERLMLDHEIALVGDGDK